MKEQYYTLEAILDKAPEAKYYVIFGERSNGKTFSVLNYGIDRFLKNREQLAIIRRYKEDFQGNNAQSMFNMFLANDKKGNIIEKKTRGMWNEVVYKNRMWFFAHVNENGEKDRVDDTPFAYRFSLTEAEHGKSISYPRITTILFDEFLTREYYLQDEFVTFSNVLSTIIRDRDNVKIFMCGNTINKYCPYFSEMGLTNVRKMKKGTIDVYEYGESSLRVAVEYSDFPAKKKKSDVYFAFDNPKLKMITSGDWEISIYPHLPARYERSNVIYEYFIEFEKETLHAEIVDVNETIFTYIHRKTTPIRDDGTSLIFSQEINPRPNHSRNIGKPVTELERKIAGFFVREKVFYQDNEVGEIVNNFLKWSRTNTR